MAAVLMATVRPVQALTSVRGLAAWWVVLFHFQAILPKNIPLKLHEFLSHGYLAVDLFFELSGFVIALNYAHRFKEFNPILIRNFLLLRFARIYPLYIFTLFLFVLNPISIHLFSHESSVGARYGIKYFVFSIFMIQNWGFFNYIAWNIPAWSISTEVCAYIFFPFFTFLCVPLLKNERNSLGMILVLLVSLSISCVVLQTTLGGEITPFGVFRCIVEFSIGTAIFSFRERVRPARIYGDLAALIAMICFFLFAKFTIPDFFVMPAGFAALILSLTYESSITSKLLNFKWIEFAGRISYSTYLIHYFVKDWVKFLLERPSIPWSTTFVAYLTITGIASVFLYYWVEVPGQKFLRYKIFNKINL